MSFSMATLLMHSEQVPTEARAALRDAHASSAPEERDAKLASAARILYAETDLPCEDVLELVDLERASCD